MVEKSIEKKFKANNFFELLRSPENSWVKINGKEEFKVPCPNLNRATTLYERGNYICKNHYSISSDLSKPIYIEQFLKGMGGDSDILRFSRMIKGVKE